MCAAQNHGFERLDHEEPGVLTADKACAGALLGGPPVGIVQNDQLRSEILADSVALTGIACSCLGAPAHRMFITRIGPSRLAPLGGTWFWSANRPEGVW